MIGPAPFRALAFAVIALSFMLAAGCSTRPNPAFCCSDPADCSRFGVTDERRECADGFACVGNTCVSECVDATDCDSTEPVCENNLCRGCTLDTECSSGACAEDGTCAKEASVVYLHPEGQDAVPCSRDQPCKDLGFGVRQTNSARMHVVLAPGSYAPPALILISSQTTTAPRLSIHGGGAALTGGSSDGFIDIRLPTTLRDLEIVNPTNPGGSAIYTNVAIVVERTKVRGHSGILTLGETRLVDVDIRATDRGIASNGTLTIDRVTISGGAVGIRSGAGTVDITNLLVSGTSEIGLDFTNTSGSVAFSTIADTGNSGAETPGVRCQSGQLDIRSTIIWTPGSSRASTEGQCRLSSMIAGPIGVVGATNANPVFVDPVAGNYHLSGGSPARDMVDTGPMTDFEGDPRPRGLRFDIGADEAP
jgi:hypothetical protein